MTAINPNSLTARGVGLAAQVKALFAALHKSLRFGGAASDVNRITISSAATTVAPSVAATGDDSNIDLALTPKGTGNVKFGTYTGSAGTITGYITIKDAAGTTRKIAVTT